MSTSEYENSIIQEMELVDFQLPDQKECVLTGVKMSVAFFATGGAVLWAGNEISEHYESTGVVPEITAAVVSAPMLGIGALAILCSGIEGVKYIKNRRRARKLYELD
jgi:hypothetical protein